MQTAQTSNLIRKQFLISNSQIKKLDRIARDKGFSSAEIVRQAIEAYDPDVEMDTPELLELVAERVKEAIADTVKTRKRLNETLKNMGVEET